MIPNFKNTLTERVNLNVQSIKRTTKGYGVTPYFVFILYFHPGGLENPL